MVIVSTSGVYISVVGPYLARNEDATFLQHIMDVLKWDKTDDILIIDRVSGILLHTWKNLAFRLSYQLSLKKGGEADVYSRCKHKSTCIN